MAAADNESGPGIMRRKRRKNGNDRTIWATVIKPWSHVSDLPDASQIGLDLKEITLEHFHEKLFFSSSRSDFHQKQRSAKWLDI